MIKKLFIIFTIACLFIGAFSQTKDAEDTFDQVSKVIQLFADDISAGRNADANYCLDQMNSKTFEDDFGPLMDSLAEAGCLNGVKDCDFTKLSPLFSQLHANAGNQETINKTGILVGSIIGSLGGDVTCAGSDACEWLGAKIGATLICLSSPKQVYQQIETAVVALDGTATQVDETAQDAVNEMTDAAKKVANEIQKSVQVMEGFGDEAANSLSDVRGQIDVTNSAPHNKPVAGQPDGLFGIDIPFVDDIVNAIAPPAINAVCGMIPIPGVSDVCPTIGGAILGAF